MLESEALAGLLTYSAILFSILAISLNVASSLATVEVFAVVVSEETGAISLMNDGRMVSYLNEARLRNMLAGLLKISLEENGK